MTLDDLTGLDDLVDLDRHPIRSEAYGRGCRTELDLVGALVLADFLQPAALAAAVAEAAPGEHDAFYASTTHNVYLTYPDPTLPPDHAFNRQVRSTKGLIADDQLAPHSPLRVLYDDVHFRRFVATVVGVDAVYPYADEVSSINVHYAPTGRELGWHFDNSAFAVTLLLQASEGGGDFDYVPAVRDSAAGDQAFDQVADVLDGVTVPRTLAFDPGSLVLFRGRDALHRVTPTTGDTTRLLVVFAFNEQPGVALSDSARMTFYGRTG